MAFIALLVGYCLVASAIGRVASGVFDAAINRHAIARDSLTKPPVVIWKLEQ
jgi:hypothetical protein